MTAMRTIITCLYRDVLLNSLLANHPVDIHRVYSKMLELGGRGCNRYLLRNKIHFYLLAKGWNSFDKQTFIIKSLLTSMCVSVVCV